jgi:hypothetical protein
MEVDFGLTSMFANVEKYIALNVCGPVLIVWMKVMTVIMVQNQMFIVRHANQRSFKRLYVVIISGWRVWNTMANVGRVWQMVVIPCDPLTPGPRSSCLVAPFPIDSMLFHAADMDRTPLLLFHRPTMTQAGVLLLETCTSSTPQSDDCHPWHWSGVAVVLA